MATEKLSCIMPVGAPNKDERARRPRPLHLRAHHLLCLHGFRGLGYSHEFVANMRRIKQRLEQDSLVVGMHVGPDTICRACPHLATRAECSRPDGTDRDRAVVAALGIEPGTVKPWPWWVHRVRARITPQRLAAICADCSWFPLGYCQAGIERLHEHREGG
jgi:hypothetical protein